MNLLIVGGAGFIGLNYIKQLLNDELSDVSKFTVLDSFTYASNKSELNRLAQLNQFEVLEHDIRDRENLLNINLNFDCILNFAAESHVDRSITNPSQFISTNVQGLQNLLDLARNRNARFLQVSTDEVYGSIEEGSWTESSPLLPNSPYAASKASADLLVRSYSRTYGLETVITRSCNNYGPHQHAEKFIPKVITNLRDRVRVPIYGDGLNSREWIHVRDNSRGIHKALLKGDPGSIYNLGSRKELTNLALFDLICEVGNFDKGLVEFVTDRLGHDFRYSVNTEKATQELNFAPSIDFVSGLRETIDFYTQKI